MRTTLSILLIIACNIIVTGQNPNGDYNPYVASGEVTPSPLWSVQADGSGVVTFEIGNTGADPLYIYDEQYITLTITLSHGEPDAVDPEVAIGGTAAGLFSWSYYDGTYAAKQVSTIPAGYSGIVTIEYSVSENSASPGMNGFNVNISPAPYQTNSNSQEDDAVSSYTYTLDENLLLNEYLVEQLLIKPNPTTGLFQIELDSLYGEFILEIISVNGIVIIQRTVDIHPQAPTVTVQGKNLDNGFYTVRLHNQNRVYYGKLMIVNE